jgi:hypothetical protein
MDVVATVAVVAVAVVVDPAVWSWPGCVELLLLWCCCCGSCCSGRCGQIAVAVVGVAVVVDPAVWPGRVDVDSCST